MQIFNIRSFGLFVHTQDIFRTDFDTVVALYTFLIIDAPNSHMLPPVLFHVYNCRMPVPFFLRLHGVLVNGDILQAEL